MRLLGEVIPSPFLRQIQLCGIQIGYNGQHNSMKIWTKNHKTT
jgi:hypothetical protein